MEYVRQHKGHVDGLRPQFTIRVTLSCFSKLPVGVKTHLNIYVSFLLFSFFFSLFQKAQHFEIKNEGKSEVKNNICSCENCTDFHSQKIYDSDNGLQFKNINYNPTRDQFYSTKLLFDTAMAFY